MIQTHLPSTTGASQPEAIEKPKQSAGDPPTEKIEQKPRKRTVVTRKRKREPEQSAEVSKSWSEPLTGESIVDGEINLKIPFCYDKKIRPRRRFLTALRELTAKQRFGLNVLLEGLQIEGAELEHGAAVNSHVNTIRALLEMAADAAKNEIEKI